MTSSVKEEQNRLTFVDHKKALEIALAKIDCQCKPTKTKAEPPLSQANGPAR